MSITSDLSRLPTPIAVEPASSLIAHSPVYSPPRSRKQDATRITAVAINRLNHQQLESLFRNPKQMRKLKGFQELEASNHLLYLSYLAEPKPSSRENREQALHLTQWQRAFSEAKFDKQLSIIEAATREQISLIPLKVLKKILTESFESFTDAALAKILLQLDFHNWATLAHSLPFQQAHRLVALVREYVDPKRDCANTIEKLFLEYCFPTLPMLKIMQKKESFQLLSGFANDELLYEALVSESDLSLLQLLGRVNSKCAYRIVDLFASKDRSRLVLWSLVIHRSHPCLGAIARHLSPQELKALFVEAEATFSNLNEMAKALKGLTQTQILTFTGIDPALIDEETMRTHIAYIPIAHLIALAISPLYQPLIKRHVADWSEEALTVIGAFSSHPQLCALLDCLNHSKYTQQQLWLIESLPSSWSFADKNERLRQLMVDLSHLFSIRSESAIEAAEAFFSLVDEKPLKGDLTAEQLQAVWLAADQEVRRYFESAQQVKGIFKGRIEALAHRKGEELLKKALASAEYWHTQAKAPCMRLLNEGIELRRQTLASLGATTHEDDRLLSWMSSHEMLDVRSIGTLYHDLRTALLEIRVDDALLDQLDYCYEDLFSHGLRSSNLASHRIIDRASFISFMASPHQEASCGVCIEEQRVRAVPARPDLSTDETSLAIASTGAAFARATPSGNRSISTAASGGAFALAASSGSSSIGAAASGGTFAGTASSLAPTSLEDAVIGDLPSTQLAPSPVRSTSAAVQPSLTLAFRGTLSSSLPAATLLPLAPSSTYRRGDSALWLNRIEAAQVATAALKSPISNQRALASLLPAGQASFKSFPLLLEDKK